MHDQQITRVPDLDALTRRSTLEQVMKEAIAQMPEIDLAGCMTVVAELVPVELWVGRVHPMCFWNPPNSGQHYIPTPWVWKDVETNKTYCHIRCAAAAAIEKAGEIAHMEGVIPGA